MKKSLSILLILALCISLAGCSKTSDTDVKQEAKVTEAPTAASDVAGENKTEDSKKDIAATEAPAPVEDKEPVINKTLTIETEVKDGYTFDNGVYSFTKGGIYRIIGDFDEGQLYVNAPDEEITLELNGVNLSSKKNSVIFVEKAEEVKIKAIDGTVNYLNDLRDKKVSDNDDSGSACIYSKDDLKLQGKGSLYVSAGYNNGIHSKNDIKIKNLTLEVTAPGNAIKGNDSITIESGTISITSTEGDGLKTKDTDISSKGKQRGIIAIEGGTVTIKAASDCIKAAFDVQISPEANVFTNK